MCTYTIYSGLFQAFFSYYFNKNQNYFDIRTVILYNNLRNSNTHKTESEVNINEKNSGTYFCAVLVLTLIAGCKKKGTVIDTKG